MMSSTLKLWKLNLYGGSLFLKKETKNENGEIVNFGCS